MTDLAPSNAADSAMRAELVNPLSEPADQTQFQRSLAVVIGIDAYGPGIPRLRTAVNDATRLAELLAATHGYEAILLAGQESGEPVSGERLRSLFSAELPARLGQEDRLLLYFAGHGVALDGDDGPAGYLVPQDARPGDSASMLPMTDLHAWLSALPCRHMLAILDCCFAGAFRWAATRHIGALPDVIHQERFDRYLRSPAWQVLTSAAYDEKALDVLGGNVLGRREAEGRHSPFAQALIEALERGSADLVPRGQGDGVITATELYLYLREQVEVQAEAQVGHQQTPGLWPLKKHRKGEFIFLAPGHALNLPPAPELTGEANPYRGLKSYDQRHTQLFFGREHEIRELAALVDRQPFVAVLGASGTGKSSLVKAGLLQRLQEESGKLQAAGGEGCAPYHVLAPMRPTDQPLRALAALLRAERDADPSGFGNPKGLARDDRALAEVVARWAQAHPGQRLVLTIDQFEELATLCRDDAEREHFLRLLAAAVQQQPDAFRLILTLRTDFEPQFTQEGSPLAELWLAGRYVVPPMDIEDLRQVIEGPASVRVLYFDPPELVDDLIKEVIQTPGALPLLSFTLSELYVKYVRSDRDDRALSGADYQALGGVVGSLRNRATEEYDALPDDAHRATMQRVMLRMVAVEGGGLARRRVALSELEYPTEKENARVRTVLDRLVEARLLVRGAAQNPDGAKGETYVEPAHDALVLAWDKLLRWRKEAEEYLPLQRRLAQAATEWDGAEPNAKAGLLWDDDPRLAQVEDTLWPADVNKQRLAARIQHARWVLLRDGVAPPCTQWLNHSELAFIQTSVRERARTILRNVGWTIVVLAALGILGFAWLSSQQRATANEVLATQERTAKETEQGLRAEVERLKRDIQADQLTANALKVVDKNPSLALLLAVEGMRVREQSDLITTLVITEPIISMWSASPITRTVLVGEPVVGSAQTNVHDLLGQVGGAPLTGHWLDVVDVAFSPVSLWLATASWDGTARLWDVNNPSADPVVLDGHKWDIVVAVAFSPDGRWLATASWDDTARLWDMTAADPGDTSIVLVGHTDDVVSVAFSPDVRWLATTSSDNTARSWDISNPSADPDVLAGGWDKAGTVASSPDGRWLATASVDNFVRLRDVSNLEADPIVLAGHEDAIAAVAFSPDGRWLASASEDTTVRLWTWRVNDLIKLACRFAGRNLTAEEWWRYMGQVPYRSSCAQWPAGK